MSHNAQAKAKTRRKLKNFCGWQWCGSKNPEVWFGKLGRWLELKNKGRRGISYDNR